MWRISGCRLAGSPSVPFHPGHSPHALTIASPLRPALLPSFHPASADTLLSPLPRNPPFPAQSVDIGVTEPFYGKCDVPSGCKRLCGTPDYPIERYSTASTPLDTLTLAFR